MSIFFTTNYDQGWTSNIIRTNRNLQCLCYRGLSRPKSAPRRRVCQLAFNVYHPPERKKLYPNPNRPAGWADYSVAFGRRSGIGTTMAIKVNKHFCRLLINKFKKKIIIQIYLGDEWDIPFEALSDLEHLASGTQGVVYKARMRSEIVAVKKVNDKEEIEIPALRQLNHPNIVRFK